MADRLTSNGLSRDSTDKNAVSDDHDFAALRANLGKGKKPVKETSDAKLERSRARTGLDPETATVSANQMVVKGVAKNTSADAPVSQGETDEDFAAIRAKLGKGKKPVREASDSKLEAARAKTGLDDQETVAEFVGKNDNSRAAAPAAAAAAPVEEVVEDFAALRANLGKGKPAAKPAPPAAAAAEPASTNASPFGERKASGGKMNKAPSQTQAPPPAAVAPTSDDSEFAAARAKLGHGKAPRPTSEAKLEAARARTGLDDGAEEASFADARKSSGTRLTNNGLSRDTTDKNAVEDDHDFASLRANLGKGKAPKTTSEAKLERARARTGLQDEESTATFGPGAVHVGGKTAPKACGDVRDKSGRLTNNGMDRSNADQNAVEDSHDFGALRAGLKKV